MEAATIDGMSLVLATAVNLKGTTTTPLKGVHGHVADGSRGWKSSLGRGDRPKLLLPSAGNEIPSISLYRISEKMLSAVSPVSTLLSMLLVVRRA